MELTQKTNEELRDLADRIRAELDSRVDLEVLLDGADVTESRKSMLRDAAERGADNPTLERIRDALRVSVSDTIGLPSHRYEGLSRGRGWCRKGRGERAEWGERDDRGNYRVGPGSWTVGGSDGFRRKGSNTWKVEHVQVGDETWTVAS